MKLIIICILALNVSACIHTDIKPVELCKSSPQEFSNELQCTK